MGSGEDDASQAGNTGQVGDDEEMQRLVQAFEEAQDQELDQVDTALDKVEEAGSREEAVAALIRATVGINSLYASTPIAPPVEIALSRSYNVSSAYSLYARSRRLHLTSEDAGGKLGKRLERYLKDANILVEKWKPDQYQVSVGFPQLVSVTLTWNVK